MLHSYACDSFKAIWFKDTAPNRTQIEKGCVYVECTHTEKALFLNTVSS